jgi:hypothetical protein
VLCWGKVADSEEWLWEQYMSYVLHGNISAISRHRIECELRERRVHACREQRVDLGKMWGASIECLILRHCIVNDLDQL